MLSWKMPIIHELPCKEVEIYPLSDVHYGAIEHDTEGWERVLKEILDKPNRYVFLNGDLINNCTRSSVGDIFQETAPPRVQRAYMVDALAPIKDRILCGTRGNHEARSLKDADSDPSFTIMAKLGLEDYYRPEVAFMILRVGNRGEVDYMHARASFTAAVTHGSGGGIYTGATINRAERYGNMINCDLLVVGHSHKGVISRPSRLIVDPRNEVVRQEDYVVVSSVSWIEYGGYAASKMLLPASHSTPQRIVLGNDRKGKKTITTIW